jgi:uncharacterized protein (DUF1501 family)
MKRTTFLRSAFSGLLLPSLVNGFSVRVLANSPWLQRLASSPSGDRVLVLIQLSGGNDGLNMVVPLEYYGAYAAARSNIALPQNKILLLNGFDKVGFNPAMPELQNLFNDGKINVVQGVGYPKPNFSHFRATDIWLTGADADQVLPTGWAGRYLNQEYIGFPENYPNSLMPDPLAIQVGSIVSPALQGPTLTMGMAISNTSSFYDLVNGVISPVPNSRAGDQIGYIREMAQKTDSYSNIIKKAAQKVKQQSAKYPDPGKNPLADQLKIVARLIAGGLQTKIYIVNMGGFDTHAKQTEVADTTTGIHAKLLGKLSIALDAFMDDLAFLSIDDRVLAMTFSEFGRRIKSNASGGTDHGAAAPVLVIGNKVIPGITGTNPILPTLATDNDNIGMQYDFRSIYASMLKNWFAVGLEKNKKILLNDYPVLPIIGTGSVNTKKISPS